MSALVEASAPPSSVLITACPIAVPTGLCFTGPGFAYGKIDDELPHLFLSFTQLLPVMSVSLKCSQSLNEQPHPAIPHIFPIQGAAKRCDYTIKDTTARVKINCVSIHINQDNATEFTNPDKKRVA